METSHLNHHRRTEQRTLESFRESTTNIPVLKPSVNMRKSNENQINPPPPRWKRFDDENLCQYIIFPKSAKVFSALKLEKTVYVYALRFQVLKGGERKMSLFVNL